MNKEKDISNVYFELICDEERFEITNDEDRKRILKITGGLFSGDEEKDLEKLKTIDKTRLKNVFKRNNVPIKWE